MFLAKKSSDHYLPRDYRTVTILIDLTHIVTIRRICPGSKYGDEAKYTQADALHARGLLKEAIEMLGDDDEPPALGRRSRWTAEMALRDDTLSDVEKVEICKKSLKIANLAIEKDPTYSSAYKDLAMAYGRLTNICSISERPQISKDLKAAVDKALEMDPEECAWWVVLGKWNVGIASLGWLAQAALKLIYGGMPKASYEEAIKCFLKAEECWSTPINQYELAQVYLILNQRTEAKQALEKAISGRDELPLYREAIENAKTLLQKEFA